MKEGIARALGVPEARPRAAKPLLREFRRYRARTKSEAHAKWAIANALSATADDSVFHEIAATLQDSGHGAPRSGMVASLANMRGHRDEAVELLLSLVHEEDLATQAMITLGAMREPRARKAVESFLDHEDPWVRDKARRALTRIENAGGEGVTSG